MVSTLFLADFLVVFIYVEIIKIITTIILNPHSKL